MRDIRAKIPLIPVFLGLGVSIVTALLLAAWIFRPDLKAQLAPMMKPNTCVALVLAGLSLALSRHRSLSRALAAGTLFIGALTSLEYAFGIDLGIDELIATDSISSENFLYPGRMSPIAAVSFVFLGLSLLMFGSAAPSLGASDTLWHPPSLLLLPVLALSLTAVTGYLYGVRGFYQIGPFIRIALPTAICLAVLALAIPATRPDQGPMRSITGPGAGGVLARRLVPAVFLIPLLIGWAGIEAQRRGRVDLAMGTALMVVTLVFLFGSVVAWSVKALESNEQTLRRWEHAFQNAAWGISLATADNRFIAVNRAFAEMHGTTQEEWEGRPLLDMFTERSKAQLAGLTRQVHEAGHITYESEHVRKDGSAFPVLTEVSAFKDERGEVLFRVANFQDITARKAEDARLRELSQTLEHERDKLVEAIRARDEFLSIASHELKTPLTSLTLQTQGIRRSISRGDPQALSPDRVMRLVEQTERQASRLVRLVDDMLDIARIRAGRLTIEPETFDFCEMAREVVDRLRPQLTAAGQGEPSLTLCEPAIGTWDRVRMEQVLTNLLTNATKYGRGRPIEVGVECIESAVRLRVRDHGIGIAPSDHERIFDRFERAISASEVSGLGLGLFITRQIVEAHGGKIWVESEPGRGATFFVELPRSAESERLAHAV